MTPPGDLSEPDRAAVAALFENMPSGYAEVVAKLAALSAAFRAEAARVLEPHVAEWAAKYEPTNLAQDRLAASFLDRTIRNLGLCVMANGEPGLLAAERAPGFEGARPLDAKSRFALLVRTDAAPHYFARAVVSDAVPRFKLGPLPDNGEDYLRPLRDHAYLRTRSR